MFVLPAAIGAFLLVNLLCACVALGVGFAAGVWFFGAKMAKPAPAPPEKKTSKQNEEAKRAAERAAMAASRVADLAKGMASDVGDHSAKMKAISADLAGIDRDSAGANGAVFTALDQMLSANSNLQQRLEQAEKQLAAQAQEIRTHESEARTDSLTGLSNRRAFDDELKRRLCEWERKHTPYTLVLLDIDHFKRFNDTHGHQVGDEVLRQMAKVLKAQSRDMDLPCRYGGEEFAVILPATDAASACKVAERIRAAVEASTTVCDGKTLKVTCSVGLSAVAAGDDVTRFIRRADEALYKSKEVGRNCGHWNDGAKCLPISAAVADATDAHETEPLAPTASAGARAASRATFIQVLKRRVTESHRFGVPLSVMYLKIEEYDVVGRKYGSAIARQMVDTAAAAMEKALREMDVLAKLEQGELVAMLPGKTQGEAAQIAKRMRTATNHCVLPLMDRELQLRFRHGIAELSANETAQELLGRAKQAVIATTTSHRSAQA